MLIDAHVVSAPTADGAAASDSSDNPLRAHGPARFLKPGAIPPFQLQFTARFVPLLAKLVGTWGSFAGLRVEPNLDSSVSLVATDGSNLIAITDRAPGSHASRAVTIALPAGVIHSCRDFATIDAGRQGTVVATEMDIFVHEDGVGCAPYHINDVDLPPTEFDYGVIDGAEYPDWRGMLNSVPPPLAREVIVGPLTLTARVLSILGAAARLVPGASEVRFTESAHTLSPIVVAIEDLPEMRLVLAPARAMASVEG